MSRRETGFGTIWGGKELQEGVEIMSSERTIYIVSEVNFIVKINRNFGKVICFVSLV